MGVHRRELSRFEKVAIPFLFGLTLAGAFLIINMIINAVKYKRTDPMIPGLSEEAVTGITLGILALGWLTGGLYVSSASRRTSVSNNQNPSVTTPLLTNFPPPSDANTRRDANPSSAPSLGASLNDIASGPAAEVKAITFDSSSSGGNSAVATVSATTTLTVMSSVDKPDRASNYDEYSATVPT